MRTPGCEPVMQHFSHPHPLELSNLQQALAPATCDGCKMRASGWVYACRACNYHLHITCAKMPQLIHHPFHPNHALALLPVPVYPEGSFNCDACGRSGTGFSYRCGDCCLDLHTLCASMPLSLTHRAHPHPLALAFSPPYGSAGFSCDVCGGVGSSRWLYRCAACEFDAHTSCATATQPQPGAPAVAPQRSFQPQVPLARPWQGNIPGVAPPLVNRSGSSNRPGSGRIVGQAIQQFVDGAAQQVGQSLVQTILGGGGGGGGGDQGGSSNPVFDVGSSVMGAVFGGGGLLDNSSS